MWTTNATSPTLYRGANSDRCCEKVYFWCEPFPAQRKRKPGQACLGGAADGTNIHPICRGYADRRRYVITSRPVDRVSISLRSDRLVLGQSRHGATFPLIVDHRIAGQNPPPRPRNR
jgi:hypothetical protein